MSTLLWGKVYFQAHFAGLLHQLPGGGSSFTYDEYYLAADHPAIAHTLPLTAEPYTYHTALPPFFDNLVAEGWLAETQTRLLGKRQASRFELLLAFGQDCAGAVSVVDPERVSLTDALLEDTDQKAFAVLASHASLSGVQPKLAVVEKAGQFYPARAQELSTHIAKFPSAGHPDLLENEYLATQAIQALLPKEFVVTMRLGQVEGQQEQALLIKRFDRQGDTRVHFEEYAQLLGISAESKYEGAYQDLSHFIHTTPGCLPTENYRLYLRIVAGILLGNTDMHLKNFAMMHTSEGLRLAPIYDTVAAALYQYKTLALAISGARNLKITELSPRKIIALGKAFALPPAAIEMAWLHLASHKDKAASAIESAHVDAPKLKQALLDFLEKRWNGTFLLIGQNLSKQR